METKEYYTKAVESYVNAYNRFDINGMCVNLSKKIVFENISGGNAEMRIEGIENFKKQAETAKAYFSERHQIIENLSFNGHVATAEIDYTGILATDLPNGMKKGDTLKLKGISEFTFENDEIVSIRDIS
ncbi:nuclear transport factor 2 family protein [uncultured Chryseobacterium sp.]|uniref:nuclear transport factor 2 family protein n=1 Tax=uncultured Chryseobacterium sp. TaxID=259322 RepID=UPI002600973E|nr:nuclear transport factor 2 family protein [uncultured Chryseobacterium sp.]